MSFHEVQSAARACAEADEAVWVDLSHEERVRYERIARASFDSVGLDVVSSFDAPPRSVYEDDENPRVGE